MEEQKKNKMKLTILDMTQIAFFAALMAVCAWIVVPVPNIPFTLQVFAIFAALCTLGGKKGTISIIVYILLGAVGALCLPALRAASAYWRVRPEAIS